VDEHGTAHHLRDRTSLPEGSDAPADPFVADEAARACIVGELYKSYYHRVFCFSRRFVRDEEAEEVAHEAFVRLFRVKNLERMTISVAYLLRIAENLLKRRHERALRYRRVLEQSGIVSGLHGMGERRGESSERSVTGEQARTDLPIDSAQLAAVLGQLTREEQAAVRLIVCEGLDYQAAARSLGVPVSTINNWKHRGLSKLKQLIGRSRARTSDDGPLAAG
jgi:RNA polymerase sigma-70 factor (ECF subfamily)